MCRVTLFLVKSKLSLLHSDLTHTVAVPPSAPLLVHLVAAVLSFLVELHAAFVHADVLAAVLPGVALPVFFLGI